MSIQPVSAAQASEGSCAFVMGVEMYATLRECELAVAWQEARADIEARTTLPKSLQVT